MRRPSFQFYPADWTGNSNLRRCSHAEKGVWLEVMCLMHDQEEYGVLRWSLKEVAQAAGCSVGILKGLITKGVLKGDDKRLVEPYIYTPRSGRKDGDPVTLVATQEGPIWYSSRMVKDEYVRTNAGASTRFGAEPKAKAAGLKPRDGTERAKLRARVLEKTGGICYHCSVRLVDPWEIDHLMPRSKGGRHTFANLVPSCVACNQDKSDTLPDDWSTLNCSPSRRHGEDQGGHQGDGSTSSSSSSPSGTSDTGVSGADAPVEPAEVIFGRGVPLLTASGVSEKNARSMLGMLRKTHGDEDVIAALQACVDSRAMEPVAYLQGVLRAAKSATRPRTSRAEDRANWMASFWQPAQPTMKDMGTIDATR